MEEEAELTDGFKFTVTPKESAQLGIGNYETGHECMFMVKASLIKNDNATLTFQANEIEKVGTDKPMDIPKGSSPMYKSGMGMKMGPVDKNKVQYVRPTTEAYVS
jgi:hypothetical protein